MKTLSERVSYLRGLADGLELDTSSKQNRLLTVMIDILEDMAYSIEDVQDIAERIVRGV